MTLRKSLFILLVLAVGVLIGLSLPFRLLLSETADRLSISAESTTAPTHGPGDGHDHGATTESATDNPNLDWCDEHRVPESECTQCVPSRATEFRARRDWCDEHNLPESHCRLCHPDLEFPQEKTMRANEPVPELGLLVYFPPNRRLCATDDAVIQFSKIETFERTGLTVQPVLRTTTGPTLEAPAEVVFDQTKATLVTLPVAAVVVSWQIDPGTRVVAGQAIAFCESQSVAALKGEYLAACVDAERRESERARQQALKERGLIDASTYESALAEAQAADATRQQMEHQLRALGLTDGDLREVREDKKLTARYSLRAPATGTLVERVAPLGETLESGTKLAVIADPSALWIEARVRDNDLSRIRPGQTVVFTSDAGLLDRTEGRVIWASQYLDPMTRSGIVRAVPSATENLLRAHEFGRLDILEDDQQASVLVPKDAVQWEGCCHVVFVRESETRFRPQKVVIGRGDTEHYRILEGLGGDEWVVVKGSFLLKTELKKSSIGAGCCGLDAKG